MNIVVERVAVRRNPLPVKRSCSTWAPSDKRQGRSDLVIALARKLDHGIADIVDEIDVIAGAAVHRVGPDPAVELVVAAVCRTDVVSAQAEDLVCDDDVPLRVSLPPVPLM